MSVTKAVVYLWLGALLSMALGIGLMRGRGRLTRRETVGELIYDVAQTQVAEQGLPSAHIKRWFPYVATLMIFIFTINLIGFIPLPFGEKWHGVPTFGIYAATSSLAVTLALALLTFVFTHFEGIRFNGPVKYFKSWIPEVPAVMLPLIVPLEILGQFMRLISLAVRLYANMLAGHMLILTFIGLGFVLTRNAALSGVSAYLSPSLARKFRPTRMFMMARRPRSEAPVAVAVSVSVFGPVSSTSKTW